MKNQATKTAKTNVETTNVENVKVAKIRKTTDEKIVELKLAIERQFNVNQEQITKFTIAKLANSAKKTNLVDFYKDLIVEIVLKPETLNRF